MRYRRVREHPLDIGLSDGDDIPERHRQHSQNYEHPLPIAVQVAETVDQQPHCQRKTGKLWCASEKQRHGRRRPMVHVGYPHMKRDSTELERQADYQEDQTKHEYLVFHTTGA